MNTLSRQYTASFFSAPLDYQKLRHHWHALVNSERKHELKAVHHLAYLVLCGKDWRKAFTFPSNSNKLNNGYTPALFQALLQLRSPFQETFVLQPFDDLINHETLNQARTFLGHVFAPGAQVSAGGTYTGDAYTLPGQPDMEK